MNTCYGLQSRTLNQTRLACEGASSTACSSRSVFRVSTRRRQAQATVSASRHAEQLLFRTQLPNAASRAAFAQASRRQARDLKPCRVSSRRNCSCHAKSSSSSQFGDNAENRWHSPSRPARPAGPHDPNREKVVPKAAVNASAALQSWDVVYEDISLSETVLGAVVRWGKSLKEAVFNNVYDRDILRLLLPACCGVFLDPVMGVISAAIVGRLGSLQLGAWAISNMIYFTASSFFMFFSVVTTPAVAGALAKDDKQEASQAIAAGVTVALACGVALAAGLYLNAPALVSLLRPDPAVAGLAVGHLRIRALAAPASLLMHVAAGAFRGYMDTKTPLFAGMAQNGTNLVLDLGLILGLGWGLTGSALSASAALYASCFVIFGAMLQRNMLDGRDLARLPAARHLAPMGQTFAGLGVCIVATAAALLTSMKVATGMGVAALAAHTIVQQVLGPCGTLCGSFNTVAQALSASYLGKGARQAAQEAVGRVIQMGSALGACLGVAVFLTRGPLTQLFSSDPVVLAQAQALLPIVAAYLPFSPMQQSLEGVLLGSMQLPYLFRRTIAAGLLGCVWQWGAARAGWGLAGVWFGVLMLPAVYLLHDSLHLKSRKSPFFVEPEVAPEAAAELKAL